MSVEGGIEALREKVYEELNEARNARMQDNEGRARVCARRAAGWAIESIYAAKEGEALPESNAYRFLQWFEQQQEHPRALREAAGRLTTRVNEDFNLPFTEDPLEDAEWIVGWVFDHCENSDSH